MRWSTSPARCRIVEGTGVTCAVGGGRRCCGRSPRVIEEGVYNDGGSGGTGGESRAFAAARAAAVVGEGADVAWG
jgi:hypothetical protein